MYPGYVVLRNFTAAFKRQLIYGSYTLVGCLPIIYEDVLHSNENANQLGNCHSWPKRTAHKETDLEDVAPLTTIFKGSFKRLRVFR